MDNYPYITLLTSKKLESSDIKNWYRIVKSFLPSGMLSSIQNANVENANEPILLVREFDKDTQEYSFKIPLTRDLLPEEVEPIADAYNDITGDAYDYTILASTLFASIDQVEEIKDDTFEKIAKNIARYLYTKEMKKKLENGWRYGIEDDHYEKISSTLLPFDSVGPELQNIDIQLINEVIRELNENGFLVIKKGS